MKFIKKAAALFFCAALALSVMAISALADDEAVLLSGVGKQGNPEFQVTLTPVASQTGIEDRDSGSVEGYEINKTQTVDYELYLAYKHGADSPYPAFISSSNIDGFQFDYDSVDTDNHGATIAKVETTKKVTVGSVETPVEMAVATANSHGTQKQYVYSYTTGGVFQMTDTGRTVGDATDGIGVKIATITVAFTSADQNVAIKPTIKNIMISVEGCQYIQIPVATPADGKVANFELADGDATYPPSIATYVTEGNTVAVDNTALTSVTVQPDMPTYVNPVYVATVEHFKTVEANGFVTKKGSSDAGYQTYVTYNYSSGNMNATAAAASSAPTVTNVTNATTTYLENEQEFAGYTFQGWMVTGNANSSLTWAKYSEASNPWDETGSFPATTVDDGGDTMPNTPTWETHDWSKSDGAKNDLPTSGPVTGSAYNFIPKGSGANATIPAGLVGDITLTPVYTRNVYVATFDAGDASTATKNPGMGRATFGSNFNATPGSNGTAESDGSYKAASYTKNYTIEDLYKDSAAFDFLELKKSSTDTTVANGPQGLSRNGFKWVGWKISDQNDIATGYKWLKNDDTRVNNVPVLIFDDAKNADGTDKHPTTAKHYGDVEFTAEWELDICFAKIDYAYATGSSALILVGVPNDSTNSTANYEGGYTYKCDGKSMFIIPESPQRGGYVSAAYDATPKNGDPATFTFTDTYLTGADKNGAYVLYAYIDASNLVESKITLEETIVTEESTTKPGNVTIDYDGDIDDTDGVNVGDFGNVANMIGTVENGPNNNNTVLVITVHAFVKARLQADVDNTDTTTNDFGSIKDVVAIYNKMFTT